MNQMLLEGLSKMMQNLGIFAMDHKTTQTRINEHPSSLFPLCLSPFLASFSALFFSLFSLRFDYARYKSNVEFCREVIELQMDDARAQGDLTLQAARFGNTRHACRQLTSEFVRQLTQEVGHASAGAGSA